MARARQMSFAEQLAARASEAQSHKRPPRPDGAAPRVNGGKIVPSGKARTRAGGRSGGAPNDGGGTRDVAARPSPGGPGLFAEQLRCSSGSLNRLDRKRNELSSGRDNSAASDLSLSSSTPSSPLALNTPSPLPRSRKSLLPADSPGYFDGDEDEYDLVGFSLMSADADDGGDDEDDGGDEGGGSPAGRKNVPSELQTKPTAATPEHIMDSPSFRDVNLSPIVAKGAAAILSSPSSSSSSIPRQQRRLDRELKSKLERQLLKCQTESERMLSSQRRAPPPESGGVAVDSVNSCTDDSTQNTFGRNSGGDGDGSENAIFGAWAQIESLQRRCREAEDRARRERERAEVASYELSLIVDAKEQWQNDASEDMSQGHDRRCNDVADSFSSQDGAMTRDKEGRAGDARSGVQNALVRIPQEQDPSDGVPQHPSDEAAQWKRRALEAEERLAREARRLERAPPLPPSSPPPSQCEESPDLLRLKNVEIDVLRDQVRRLERRLREERERADDLLSSSCLGSGPLPLDDIRPPLVVVSERSTVAGVDELRLLRNEMRNLQYQLRAGKTRGNNGTDPTSAYSTTGESTLSSLDADGNENAYGDDADVGGGREVDEDDGNNASTSSYSSFWGLCCVRRSGRGYGRV